MNLSQWMAANGLKLKEVADMIPMHRTGVWKIKVGKRMPSPKVMDKLVAISNGAITRAELRPDLYPEHRSHQSASAAE